MLDDVLHQRRDLVDRVEVRADRGLVVGELVAQADQAVAMFGGNVALAGAFQRAREFIEIAALPGVRGLDVEADVGADRGGLFLDRLLDAADDARRDCRPGTAARGRTQGDALARLWLCGAYWDI